MILLRKYEDFLSRADELGFMAFSNILPGLPSLTEETPKELWHTGDPDSDPWCWKDRAAAEKRLAFGCLLGGHKGFVSARLYSLFYAAYHPREAMEERRASGQVSQTVWQLWQLFNQTTSLDTSAIRQRMDVTAKSGGGEVDKAIKELQQGYYIAVAGSRRRLDKYGQPHGWPGNIYHKLTDWIPKEWMDESAGMDAEEAREKIVDAGIMISQGVTRAQLTRRLGL